MSRHEVDPVRRVVFDHQIFSKQQFGGISRYFTELARQLSQDTSWEVEVLAFAHVNDHLRTLDARLVHGWRVPHYRRLAPLWQALDDRLTERQLARRSPAILHRTYYAARPVTARCPTVLTVYDMIHERFPSYFPEERALVARKRAAVLDADRVLCISESTRRDLLDVVPVDPARVSVVPLAAGLEPAPPTVPRVCAEPYLLCVGQRGAHKNFDGLLQALRVEPRLLESHRLVLFGGAPWTPQDADAVRALGLPVNAIRHVGHDDTLLPALYRDASALVVPASYEGFGLPVLEAMRCGCPVVCSAGSSLPEVGGDAAEYCDTSDPEAFAAAITRVLDDPERRAGMRERGQRQAGRFSWGRCAAETAAVYRSAIAAR